MKLTLLEMVQSILNDMDSDSVNSIDDTEESLQVASIIKDTYYRLLSKQDWAFLRTLAPLTALADTDNPTKMLIPPGFSNLKWIRYNKKPVTYLPPADFKCMIDERTVSTDVVDANGYRIDNDPSYWTTYDDLYVVFDGYDADEESTLQESKCSAYASVLPSWTASNSFTPTLPAKMFPTLLADAKGTAFLTLKQQANAKEEAIAKTGRSQMQQEHWRTEHGKSTYNDEVNYGRRR